MATTMAAPAWAAKESERERVLGQRAELEEHAANPSQAQGDPVATGVDCSSPFCAERLGHSDRDGGEAQRPRALGGACEVGETPDLRHD